MKAPASRRTPAVHARRIHDPLAAVPLRPGNVEARPDRQGHLHLRLTVPLKGFRRRVADWLGYDYSRQVELDATGTLYYGLVDGQSSLRTIVGRMAETLGKTAADMEPAVVLFTKKLMTMNMLALKVPDTACTGRV